MRLQRVADAGKGFPAVCYPLFVNTNIFLFYRRGRALHSRLALVIAGRRLRRRVKKINEKRVFMKICSLKIRKFISSASSAHIMIYS